MSSSELHPAQRFSAPSSIQRGVPLATLLGPVAIGLLADSLRPVVSGFDRHGFLAAALRGLDGLGLMDRADHIADALAGVLPREPRRSLTLLTAALGPPLRVTAGSGLAPFFYLPHSSFISRHGIDDCVAGMAACHALTQRFTAEFALRPFLIRHQATCLAELEQWTRDPNPHVRRLVSEGTRPRLPWAMRLPAFQRDPAPVLPLLEALKDDDELYVRRSVANHLGDIAKDHPALAFSICRRWCDEKVPPQRAAARRWMVCHAVRLPAKQGVAAAVKIRAAARAFTPGRNRRR